MEACAGEGADERVFFLLVGSGVGNVEVHEEMREGLGDGDAACCGGCSLPLAHHWPA
jgi:hypothetical protein